MANTRRRKRKLPKVISRAEAHALLAAIDSTTPEGIRDRLALELMYRAGLRVSEVVNLKPRDVHEQFIVIYDSKGGDGTAYFTPGLLNPLILRWLDIRERWLQEYAPDDRTPFLCKHDGSPLTSRYLQRLVNRLKVQVGIAGICTPHTLRHSFATEALEDGFTIIQVQSLLRHASATTTMVYLHVRDDELLSRMARRGMVG